MLFGGHRDRHGASDRGQPGDDPRAPHWQRALQVAGQHGARVAASGSSLVDCKFKLDAGESRVNFELPEAGGLRLPEWRALGVGLGPSQIKIYCFRVCFVGIYNSGPGLR